MLSGLFYRPQIPQSATTHLPTPKRKLFTTLIFFESKYHPEMISPTPFDLPYSRPPYFGPPFFAPSFFAFIPGGTAPGATIDKPCPASR